MPNEIHIELNGEPHTCPHGTTVLGLIGNLGLGGQRIAVERNREVVPRAQHDSVELAEGDAIELVTFVGGG
jgi:sulfur carrier protein